MTAMFLICGGLSTIIIVVYLLSVYIARWFIRSDFGAALTNVLSEPDQELVKEFNRMTKLQIAADIAQTHCDMKTAIKKQQFALVARLNRKIHFAMDVLYQKAENENSTLI